MTITVLGVDPSLAATGLCRITIDDTTPPWQAEKLGDLVDVATVTVKTSGSTTDLPPVRRDRVAGIRRQILRAAVDCDLALIETPFANMKTHQAALLDRAWLWGSTLDGLRAMDIPVAHVAVAKVKMLATGKGGGAGTDKADVANGIGNLWGDHADAYGNNEFDALTLATIGAIKLARTRLPIRVLERHLTVVAGIDWQEAEQAGII